MKHALFTLILFLTLPLTAQAATYKDVVYGSLDAEKLDIYTPDNANKAPVMVYVHGGGWMIGKKSRVGNKPDAFNGEGFILVSVEYPLLPDYGVEQQATSVAKATTWVSRNIEDYGGNQDNIHIMGHSAGAHLIALVAVDHTYLQKFGASPKVIKSATPLDTAALNVPYRMSKTEFETRLVSKMFYSAFGRNPNKWEDFSPYHNISNGYIPPFHVLSADRESAAYTGDQLVRTLKSRGIKAQHTRFPDHSHRTINQDSGERTSPVFKSILDFIR